MNKKNQCSDQPVENGVVKCGSERVVNMKNYLLKCLYQVKTRGGKLKTKKENIYLRLDATPEQIHHSKKLHISLGKAVQKKNLNKVIAIEIKEVIELENNGSEKSNDHDHQVDRSPENESGEIRKAEKEKPENTKP